MNDASIAVESVRGRMEDLGLSFMAAGFESFLGNPRQADETLLDSIRDLICRQERTDRENQAQALGHAASQTP